METGLDGNLAPGEADYGTPLDEEWLRGVTFVDFSDDAVPDSDYETAPAADRAAERRSRRQTWPQLLAELLRQAGAVARGLGLAGANASTTCAGRRGLSRISKR